MNATFKTVMLWMSLLVVIFLAWHFANIQKKEAPLTFSEFIQDVELDKVDEVTITGTEIKGKRKPGNVGSLTFKTSAPTGYEKYIDTLLAKKVKVTIERDQTPAWANMLISWAPFLLLIGFWVFFMRQMQSGGNKALSFGKSKAKLLASQQKKVTFKDVAGVDEAKEELQEIIEFLREPQKFQKLGGRIPKGVLLMGPPGTGKTLLARAIAGEANVPVLLHLRLRLRGDVRGRGRVAACATCSSRARRTRPASSSSTRSTPSGRHRGAGLGGGHDEREQTLNQLLVEMDGFESNDGVILIAATNRPDVLDPALLRPGRFDRRVVVSRPDVRGREGILQVHTRKIPLSEDVDISTLARATPGFSGADLANLVNEAALLAARRGQKFVMMADFESSKDKVLMGAERKSMIITDEEKRLTAFHEGGHALVAALLPNTDPLHKVTIIPRGMALGLTQQLPTEEKHNYTKEQIESRIAVCMGGRIAEDLVFDEISTGAQNDIEQATEMARKMVCEWGMSEALGPLTYGKKEEQVFLGKEFNRHQDYSEDTALKIDAEIKRIVGRAVRPRAEDPRRQQEVPGEDRGRAARARGAGRRADQADPRGPDHGRSACRGRRRIPPREGKIDTGGERAGGILPPLAPKPTS